MTENEARRMVDGLSLPENIAEVYGLHAAAPNEPEPSVKSSSIDSRIFSWGAAPALMVFLTIVWTEFGLLATAGTFFVIFAALLIWAAKEFENMMKDGNFR